MWNREGNEEDIVREVEDPSGCTDAKREGECNHSSKADLLAREPERVGEIACKMLDKSNAARISARFLDLLHTSEGELGASPCFVRSEPAMYETLGFHVEMEAQLIVEVALEGRFPKIARKRNRMSVSRLFASVIVFPYGFYRRKPTRSL